LRLLTLYTDKHLKSTQKWNCFLSGSSWIFLNQTSNTPAKKLRVENKYVEDLHKSGSSYRCFQGQYVTKRIHTTEHEKSGGGQLLTLIEGSMISDSELAPVPSSGPPHAKKWPEQLQTSHLAQLSSRRKRGDLEQGPTYQGENSY
jgi:hypothetical protein